MENRSRSGPAHLEWPSILEESFHMDRCMRYEVHKKTQRQPSPPPQGEGLATNTEGPSYANRDVEVESMREQVALLQRNMGKEKELILRKDKELHHQRRASPAPNHSRGDERGMGDRNKKRDRRSPHSHGEREKTPPQVGVCLVQFRSICMGMANRSRIFRFVKFSTEMAGNQSVSVYFGFSRFSVFQREGY